MRKIGIICPMYNVENYIVEFIDSALSQTYGNCKLYLVDDKSTDATLENAMVAVTLRDSWEIIKHKKNKGWAVATNTAAKRAIEDGCELLFIANADDRMAATCLEELEKALVEGIDWICMTIPIFDSVTGNTIGLHQPTPNASLDMMLLQNRITNFSLVRASMWTALEGYDEIINGGNGYEDWDFWIRAIKAGYKYNILNKELYFYRDHANQTSKKVKHENVEAIRIKHKV
jgi:glycosyltransferase involved in cell wall biosynthesis